MAKFTPACFKSFTTARATRGAGGGEALKAGRREFRHSRVRGTMDGRIRAPARRRVFVSGIGPSQHRDAGQIQRAKDSRALPALLEQPAEGLSAVWRRI